MIKSVDTIYFYGKPNSVTAVALKPHYRLRIFKDYGRPAVVIKSDLPTNPGFSVINASEHIATDLVRTFMLYDIDAGSPNDIVWIDQHEHDDEPHGHMQRVTYEWVYDAKSVLEKMTGEPADFNEYRATFPVSARGPKWFGITPEAVETLVGWKLDPIYRSI